MSFFVYVLRNAEGRFYIGQTSDLQRRLQRHNEGRVFWTKSRGPWELAYSEPFETRAEAMQLGRPDRSGPGEPVSVQAGEWKSGAAAGGLIAWW